MAAFSDYTETAVLNSLLRGTAYTPTDVYVGLFTSDAGLENNTEGSQTEVSGGSYARVNITSVGPFTAPSGGESSNSAELEFPTATASWGTITHFAIMDAATSGNVLIWGAVTTPRAVDTGEAPIFRTNELSVTVQ